MPLVELIVPQAPTNVPAFLAKLWKMVDNPDTDEFISWTEDGSSFRIKDQSQFASSLLPFYYKHSNMASFIRQLNMYGFHKVIALHSGNFKSDKEEIEFAHVYFLRGQEFLLDQIKRKSSSSSKNTSSSSPNPVFVPTNIKEENVIIAKVETPDREELVNEFLVEMGQMKERQDDLDSKVENMRNENEALWGEVLSLRQKQSHQKKIVDKLIQFLVALVQPRISKGIKRKLRHPSFPSHKLAIEEDSPPSPKEAKVEEIAEEIEDCHLSSSTEFLHEEDCCEDKYTMVDPATITPSLKPIKSGQMTSQSPAKLSTLPEPDMDTLDRELDSLKDILAGSGQITLDTSFMSGLLNSADNADILTSPMKLFADSLLSTQTEENVPYSPPDQKFLTYDSNMNTSIFALAAESSGINLEEDILSTPPKHSFDVDIDF